MATNWVSHPERESFLLELLRFAGWRRQVRRGSSTRIRYELHEAARLALSRIDIHELEHLIGNGCPLETAVRIAA